ncbi:MAG: cytochrome c3 family protein, partial [Pseudomonadota bacterium]
VNWRHAHHLSAGIACTNCHGDVASLDVMAKTTTVTAMATCIGCHQASAAPATCVACHSWPAAEAVREERD